jgi:hypothetical protein
MTKATPPAPRKPDQDRITAARLIHARRSARDHLPETVRVSVLRTSAHWTASRPGSISVFGCVENRRT